MKEKDLLHDEFEYEGIWFLPESKTTQVHGKLKYSNGDITLITTGSLHGDGSDFISQLKSHLKPPSMSIVQGLSTDGRLITLVDCTRRGANLSQNGLLVTRYDAMMMFVGKHFDSKIEIKFTNFSIQYSNLYIWMAKRPFNLDIDAMMEKTIRLEYNVPDTVSAKLDDNLTLEIAYEYSYDFPIYQTDFYIKQTTAMTIKNLTALPMADLMEIHRCFRYFLMLAMLNPVHPLSIKASLSNTDDNTIVVFSNIRLYDHIPELSMPDEMLFSYTMIVENFENHVKTWYTLWRKHEYTLTTYFSTLLDSSHITDEIMFQRVAQVLERYHRERFPKEAEKSENTEYDSMITEMKSRLSDNPKAVRFIERFEDMGKENNLQKRILELVNMAPQAFNDSDSEKNKFSENVMHTRNYHAHGIEKLREKAVTDYELIYLTFQMMALIEGCLLTELPFTEEKRIKLITKNRTVRNYARDHKTVSS